MRPALLVLLLVLFGVTAAEARFLTGVVRWSGTVTLTETVRVEPGAELVIAPGTRVQASGGRLEVAGKLVAEGAEFAGDWEGILLKGCDADTRLQTCRISGARTGVRAIGGAPRLEDLTLEGNDVGMELRQKCAATVRHCTFAGNHKVGLFVKDDANPVVEDNRFRNNGKFGAYIFRSIPVRFSGNRFEKNHTGLMIANYGSDPIVTANHFTGNRIGILVDRAARPRIQGNVLEHNDTGIRVYRRSDPEIGGNRIDGNQVGVSVAYSSYPKLHHNDFFGNGTALRLEYQSSTWEARKGSAARAAAIASRGAFGQAPRAQVGEEQRRARNLDGTVDARENWWGKDGTAELARIGAEGNPSFIHDGRDQPTFEDEGQSYPLDKVRFSPWLKARATEQP